MDFPFLVSLYNYFKYTVLNNLQRTRIYMYTYLSLRVILHKVHECMENILYMTSLYIDDCNLQFFGTLSYRTWIAQSLCEVDDFSLASSLMSLCLICRARCSSDAAARRFSH